MQVIGAERRQDGRVGVRRGHGGDFCRARLRAEAGRAPVNYENIVGLALAVVLALYLVGALLFPESF
ncbi:hypothetical protein BST30_21830 [Mycobacterium mantenii]|uniref:Potassium-transporting ATPase subunit F n=1 Tax=Mycobacterium mantenii TaxID=560555 RepID=A0A1X0FHI8_MYCNT|nr:hypothetical protein BST30_21830 [Mycobacterium mantenii]